MSASDQSEQLPVPMKGHTEREANEICTWKDPCKAGKADKQRHPIELEVIANVPPEYHCPPVSFEGPSHEDCKKQLELMEKHGNTKTPLYKLLQFRLTQETPKPEPRPARPQVCNIGYDLFQLLKTEKTNSLFVKGFFSTRKIFMKS